MGQMSSVTPIYETKNARNMHILFKYTIVPNIFNDAKIFRKSLTEIITSEIFQMKVRSKGKQAKTKVLKRVKFQKGNCCLKEQKICYDQRIGHS